jgi:hypothetical protein
MARDVRPVGNERRREQDSTRATGRPIARSGAAPRTRGNAACLHADSSPSNRLASNPDYSSF